MKIGVEQIALQSDPWMVRVVVVIESAAVASGVGVEERKEM